MNNNRVCCLYRVSTDRQVDYSDKHEADIPMQRKACHRFAEAKGWEIVHEEQEEGVSGHKVRASNRDKLQVIKGLALQKKFDILLVFMFDRLGRIANETPFVVEWFVQNGISVWSTQEGEQRFDDHTDKLINYIRFWQADGESEKTSVRTKTSMGQMVEAGHFKGGTAPYGYELVKSGRYNKRKHEVCDLKRNDTEAAVVKIIFDKYVNEGYGAQRIATYLNAHGYRARTGKMWHHASIRGIIANLTYTGVLRCGENRSDVLPDLQIISQEQFEAAQTIRAARSKQDENEDTPNIPMNTKGTALLTGIAYCGDCGSRLSLTTNGKYYTKKDGSKTVVQRVRYICYGKTRKQTDCKGPTGYTAHTLDSMVEDVVKGVLQSVKKVPMEEVVAARCERQLEDWELLLTETRQQYEKKERALGTLRQEIVRAILGESAFSQDTLAGLISEHEAQCKELQEICEETEAKIEDRKRLNRQISQQYREMMSWADLYDDATSEAKKMIVHAMIKRVDVFEGYKLRVEFNPGIQAFLQTVQTQVGGKRLEQALKEKKGMAS